MSDPALLNALCDPAAFETAEAIRQAQSAIRSRPLLDIELARRLPHLDDLAAERVLALLDAISDGPRLLPILGRLLRHNNPRIRSRAARTIGRIRPSAEWIKKVCSDPDARTRASAIEALWGLDFPQARALLEAATRDPGRRVAVNALVGLYMLGDASTLPRIRALSQTADPVARARAAWAMGATGDARFTPLLEEMAAPASPQRVRASARKALDCIEQAQATALAKGRLELWLAPLELLAGAVRRLRLMIFAVSGDIPIRATQVALWENNAPILDYEFQKPDPNEPLVAGFFCCSQPDLPEAARQAALDAIRHCLRQKRPIDSWCLLPSASQQPRFTTARADPEPASSSAPAASAAAETLDPFALLVSQADQQKGSSHLALLTGPQGFAAPPDYLQSVIQTALHSRITIHVIAAGDVKLPHPEILRAPRAAPSWPRPRPSKLPTPAGRSTPGCDIATNWSTGRTSWSWPPPCEWPWSPSRATVKPPRRWSRAPPEAGRTPSLTLLVAAPTG